jgi:hypothetical protein
MPTKGIHFIWTTYGTWLPGDDRGHWSPLFDLYGRIRVDGDQLNESDATTRKISQIKMENPEKTLSDAEREMLAELLGRLLKEPRGGIMPDIYAAAH